MPAASPVRSDERITSLDTIRGFALLGILLMNIVGFGLANAYDDPTNSGGATGIDLWTWVVMHVLAEGKMRCLFSMVFGAGIVLLTSRAEQRADGSNAADIHYRRNLWLGGFGILHAYLLWQGEILYPYAYCALALYPFRRAAPRTLITLAAVLMAITAACAVLNASETNTIVVEGKAAAARKQGDAKLTDAQAEALGKWEELRKNAKPTPAEVEKTNAKWRGSLWDVLKVRATSVWRWHSTAYYHFWNLDIFSMMLLGMGLFRLGVFSAARSKAFYARLAIGGYVVGITVNSITAWTRVTSGFDLVTSGYTLLTYDLGRLSVALAHASVLLLLVKCEVLVWLTRRLGAVGQMALSNYLTHSVVCSTLFCGYGFGLFGRLARHELYYVVGGLWLFQLWISPIWLRHFQFGPAEWAWRSLTYWQRQPMRR